MPVDLLFRLANLAAVLGWACLILLPRSAWLLRLGIGGVVGVLCACYATLIAVYFFPAGGGFSSLAGVQQLFASPHVLLAGWLHYLAFDLVIGWWIALRLDAGGVSRWLQAPLLLTTFMFGPLGLLLAGAVLLAIHPRRDVAAKAVGDGVLDGSAS